MAVGETRKKIVEDHGNAEIEIQRLNDENEALRLQNGRLLEQLYPKGAAAVLRLTSIPRKPSWKPSLWILCFI